MARSIGLDFGRGGQVLTSTANGQVVAHRVSLRECVSATSRSHNVDATIVPAMMDVVLLGNSFLVALPDEARRRRVSVLEKRF